MLKKIIKAYLWSIAILPLSWNYGLGVFIGFVIGRIMRHRRTESLASLERAIPGKSKKEYIPIIDGIDRNIGLSISE